MQEGVRKCVECVFGVLFGQFKILCIPSEMWTVEQIKQVSTCAVIIRNMIVEKRSQSYTNDGMKRRSKSFSETLDETNLEMVRLEDDDHMNRFERMCNVSDETKNSRYLRKGLIEALVSYNWGMEGVQ